MYVKEKITKKNIGVLVILLTTVVIVACSKSTPPVVEPDPVNRAPVAVGGDDREVAIDSIVMLDASASSDQDGDTLTYTWSLLNVPDGSSASLNNPNAVQADFTLDKAGDYQVRLQVGDGTSETTDNFTVSNKTPVITELKNFTEFPDLATEIGQQGENMLITGNFFSPDVAENKVFLGDVECEILELLSDIDESTFSLAILIPDDAVSGDIKVTVGEKNITWSKPIRILETPLAAFIDSDSLLTEKQRSPSGTYWEVGTTLKPLVSGQIMALGYRSPTVGNARFTIWDVESGEKLTSFSAQTAIDEDQTWSMLDTPISVEANKIYRVTMLFNDWTFYEYDPKEVIFPRTHGGIEIRNSVSSAQPYDSDYDEFELPTFIIDDYLYDSVDVLFVPDAQ